MEVFSTTVTFSAPSGYTIYDIASRLDSLTSNVFCWGKRTSDSYYGLLEYLQDGTFVKFIPITLLPGGTDLTRGFRISENFMLHTTAISTSETIYIYYLNNDTYPPVVGQNIIAAMIEMN